MSITADPITTEVVRNFVISCAEDMNASLWRSAHSSVIYEGKDSAVALMDEFGNMLGQSTGVPLFIGAIDACVHHVKGYYGDDIHEGDVFIMNDSYLQGTHLHDVTAIGGIFRDGELVGFGAARAHWGDIGAIDPGSTMQSTDIYQEGLRIDGPGAMDELGALMKTNNGADGLLIFRQNQQALIGQDPKRALELLLSQPARDKEFRSALEIFFHQMAISRPVDAREIIGGFLGDPARMAEIHAGNIPFSEGKTNSIAGSLAYASAMVDDAKGFEALSSGGLAMQSVDAVMRKLMAVDPGRVASIYQEKGLPKLQTFINEWSTTDPAAATAWVENHVSDPGWRAEIKSSVENADAPRNPRVYADVLLDRDDTPANRTLTASVAHGLAYTSPPAAAEWALRIRDPELFKAAVISISSLWLNEDSVQASEWISKLPAGAARDAAIRILVQAVDPMDPDSAKEWNKLLDKP